jgi:hypothetical protein
MITNQTLIIEHLSNWLAEYIKAAGRSVLVVGFRGTRADAILLHICSKATEMYGGLTTHALCISEKIKINRIFNGKTTYYTDPFFSNERYYLGCHDLADKNGIVIGPIDRTFGLYYRSYGKRSEGSADIFPLFDLEFSDICQITNNLWPNEDWEDERFSIYKDQPSVSNLEFANESEALYGIITSEFPPNHHPRWPYFVRDQKSIIAKVHSREKTTSHKKLNKPYPILSDKPQFICKRIGQ